MMSSGPGLDREPRLGRRELLTGLTAGLFWCGARRASADPPPETTRIRLVKITGICVAPQYVADDLLHAEGFTDVEYVPATSGIPTAKAVGTGAADITMNFVAPTL